jgi:thymidylate synthase
MVQQYLDHSREILTSTYSSVKSGSKGIPIISLFGTQNEYDLREGFPLMTTKQMFTKSITHELLWFFTGDTNIKYLEDRKVPIWRGNAFEHNLPSMQEVGIFGDNIIKYTQSWDDAMEEYSARIKEDEEFAERFGDAGPIYPKQWRRWSHIDEDGKVIELDQLGDVIDNMKRKPLGKKHIVSAWNHGDVPNMSLPPCHVLYQMTSNEEGEMDMMLYQRSCDQFLGVPFNFASYSMLAQIIAQEVGLTPRRFVHTFGDAHFYAGEGERGNWYRENFNELREKIKVVDSKDRYLDVLDWVNKTAPLEKDENGRELHGIDSYDHVTAILEQLSRTPRELPKMEIARKSLDELTIDDFKLVGYKDNHEPAIRRAMAV